MQTGVNCKEPESGPSIRIGYPIQALLDAPSTGCEETIHDGGVTDINQEQVDQRLRWANHILLWCHKLHHCMVELRPLRPIRRFLQGRIPIECLRHVVGQIAHITTPAVALVEEGNKGVDVGPATSATRDDLVRNDGDRIFHIVK